MRGINVKPYGLDKTYIDKDLIEDKLCQVIDQLNKGEITPVKVYSIFLNKIHTFMMEMVECVKYFLLMIMKYTF